MDPFRQQPFPSPFSAQSLLQLLFKISNPLLQISAYAFEMANIWNCGCEDIPPTKLFLQWKSLM